MLHKGENDELRCSAALGRAPSNTIESYETRAQTLRNIEYYLPELTEKELRLVYAFIRGIRKGK